MEVKKYIQENEERFLDELFSLIRIPSISAKSSHKDDILACAERWKELLLEAGAERAEVMPSAIKVKLPLSPPPTLSTIIPAKPIMQPTILRTVRRSLLKKKQASTTSIKTLSELRIAALAPPLCDNPI